MKNSLHEDLQSKLQRNKIYPYLWILIIIPLILIYKIYPLFYSLVVSTFRWSGWEPFSEADFIGLTNYLDVLKDRIWWVALKNTSIYVAFTLLFQNLFGYLIALVLFYSGIRGSKAIRSIIFFPAILAPAVVGLVWKLIFAKAGLINQILTSIGLEQLAIPWLSNKVTPIYCVAIVQIWQWTGFNMIFYLAGLQSMPEELIDAAKIDGASWLQIVTKIVTPIMAPVVTIIIILNLISGFKVFDLVYIMTRGGPVKASEVIAHYIYWNAFGTSSFGHYGYSSALSIYLILVISIFVYFRMKQMRKSEEVFK